MSKPGDICEQTCKTCGQNLIVITKNEAGCPKGHGPLFQNFNLIPKKPVKKGDK